MELWPLDCVLNKCKRYLITLTLRRTWPGQDRVSSQPGRSALCQPIFVALRGLRESDLHIIMQSTVLPVCVYYRVVHSTKWWSCS